MDKVLRICGKGKIRLRPDTVCAELTLEERSMPKLCKRRRKPWRR